MYFRWTLIQILELTLHDTCFCTVIILSYRQKILCTFYLEPLNIKSNIRLIVLLLCFHSKIPQGYSKKITSANDFDLLNTLVAILKTILLDCIFYQPKSKNNGLKFLDYFSDNNKLKGIRTGHFVKVSLWYASWLTNTRFRFLYFRICNC